MDMETHSNSLATGSTSDERLLKEKVATILVMTLVTFLGGVLPFKFLSRLQQNSSSGSRRRWKIVISLCSCFSGGVFIAACFLDLIPETEELFSKVSSKKNNYFQLPVLVQILVEIEAKYDINVEFPVTQFVVCFGFFLILFIEQAVLFIRENIAAHEEREPLLGPGGDNHPHHHHHHHHHYHNNDHDHPVVEVKYNILFQ